MLFLAKKSRGRLPFYPKNGGVLKDLFAFMDNNLFKEIDPASSHQSHHQSSVMSPVITDEEEEETQVPLTMNFTSK